MAPDPFGDLDRDKRFEIAAELGKNAEKKFREIFLNLDKWPKRYNGLYLLSFCYVYFLSSPGGIDREDRDGKLDFGSYHLELLQAHTLMHPCAASVEPLMEQATSLFEEMKQLGEILPFRQFKDWQKDTPIEELNKAVLLEGIRSFTRAVRNPAHPHQLPPRLSGIFEKVSDDFQASYGLEPKRFIAAVLTIQDFIGGQLSDHLFAVAAIYRARTFEEIWSAYRKANPADETSDAGAREMFAKFGRDVEALKASLIAYLDLALPSALTISAEDIAVFYGDETKTTEIKDVLNLWAMGFGDLANSDPTNFLLDNPVLKRPLITLGDGSYFFPLWATLPHMLPTMMESLVGAFDPKGQVRFDRAKAKYLEDRTAELFSTAFPTATIARGSKWTAPDGKRYENDLLVIIDRFALIIESKSGKFDPSARRGGELRVIDTINNLIVDAGKQAKGFIEHLKANVGVHSFDTAIRGRKNIVDNSHVHHYVPISITYENLHTIASNLRNCVEAGLVHASMDELPLCIALDDVEIVLEILENEIERIHYLTRRYELEDEVSIDGDEMDLLAFYLDTGFNLGDHDIGRKLTLNLLMKSKEVDGYYTAREQGVEISKPRLAMTRWWRDIIRQLINRKPDYWTEIGYVLLNVAKDGQREFERKVKNMATRVKAGLVETFHNYMVMETSPKHRSYVVIGYPYTDSEYKERNDVMAHALSPETVSPDKLGAVCIGVSIERDHYPYSVIAYEKRSLLDSKVAKSA